MTNAYATNTIAESRDKGNAGAEEPGFALCYVSLGEHRLAIFVCTAAERPLRPCMRTAGKDAEHAAH
jgi:hypothetical protein